VASSLRRDRNESPNESDTLVVKESSQFSASPVFVVFCEQHRDEMQVCPASNWDTTLLSSSGSLCEVLENREFRCDCDVVSSGVYDEVNFDDVDLQSVVAVNTERRDFDFGCSGYEIFSAPEG